MSVLHKMRQFWRQPSTQTALKELTSIAKNDPYKFIWYLLTTASTANSFMDHPILGNPNLNRLGLHEQRVKLAYHLAQYRRKKLRASLPQADVQHYQENGFIIKENFLDEASFAALKHELTSQALPTRETVQGDTVTRRMALDYRSLGQLPETHRLLQSLRWQNLLNYVGSFRLQPMYYVQVIFSQVKKARPDPQTSLHSDTFHPSMKAWLFLTDVAEAQGPFVYVPGSHILTPQRLAWERQRVLTINQADKMSKRGSLRITAQELSALGYGSAQKFAVKANTLVVADTYGFHARALSEHASVRIELWAFARRNPFIPWLGLDPAKLPVVRSRLISGYWWCLDQLEKRQLKHNPWRKVGMRRATDPVQILDK